MKTSPTQRSLKYLRTEVGAFCQVVEKWNAFAKVRVDLFGWIDIVALSKGRIIGVQTTTKANMGARRLKAKGNEALQRWLAVGGVLLLHGWVKRGSRWELDTHTMTAEDLDA